MPLLLIVQKTWENASKIGGKSMKIVVIGKETPKEGRISAKPLKKRYNMIEC